jgi:hypothetical protein
MPPDAGAQCGPWAGAEVVCPSGNWNVFGGVTPSSDPTYVAAYFYVPGGPGTPSLLDSQGEPCADAEDPMRCAQALEEARSEPGSRFVVVTRAGEVTRYDGAEVANFLGPVDNADDALLRAWAAGYDIRCNDTQRTAIREVEGGYELLATQLTGDCPVEVTRYRALLRSDGTIEELCSEVVESNGGCVGRRPAGLLEGPRAQGTDAAGRFFANLAFLEASAVHAFEALASELKELGAPPELADQAREAAEDEVRHAAIMARFARSQGAEPLPPRVEQARDRSLFDFALENATEGCVRETFGALLGIHQSMAARDPEVARAMAEIGGDETRHAALSWQIHEWVMPKLSEAEQRAIRHAQREAIDTLRTEAQRPLASEDVSALAGMPSPRQASELVDVLASELWS